MRDFILSTVCCNTTFRFEDKKSFRWQYVDDTTDTIQRIGWFVDVNFLHQTSYADKGFD